MSDVVAERSDVSKVGKIVLFLWDNNSDDVDDEFAFDELCAALTDTMKRLNPSGRWTAEVKNFGWRKLNGSKDVFKASTGRELLNAVLPKTDCSFKIYSYGKNGLAINNAHHDSPTWDEWYYITPVKSR